MLFYCAIRIYIPFVLLNQMEFGLKSINQEFLNSIFHNLMTTCEFRFWYINEAIYILFYKLVIYKFHFIKSRFDLILQSNSCSILLEPRSPSFSHFHQDRGRSLTVIRL